MTTIIQKYELSLGSKTKIFVENYEFGMPIIETLKSVKFRSVDEFANSLVLERADYNQKQDFLYCIYDPKSYIIKELKQYLIKHKKFIIDYIVSIGFFPNTHIYQLYLQYIPEELTEVEKNILLDGYISMLTELKGNDISLEKRKRLEQTLHINLD